MNKGTFLTRISTPVTKRKTLKDSKWGSIPFEKIIKDIKKD